MDGHSRSQLMRVLIVGCFIALAGCSRSNQTDSIAVVQDRYSTFPGSLSGGPLLDTIHVTVVDAVTGKPVNRAVVEIHLGVPFELLGTGETSKEGLLDLPIPPGLESVALTVRGAETQAYDTLSILGVRSSAITIPFTLRKPYRQHPVSISFEGLVQEDARLVLFEGESAGRDITILNQSDHVTSQPDPYRIRIPVTSPGFSALTFDANKMVRHVGFVPLFDVPIQRHAKYKLSMGSPASDDVKEIDCSIDTTSLGTGKSASFGPSPDYLLLSFADSGTTGRIVTGRTELLMPENATLRVHRLPGVETVRLEASITSSDSTLKSSSIARFSWDSLPKSHAFSLVKPATGLELHETPDRRFPGLKWTGGAGNVAIVHVHQREFNYHWSLIMPSASGENRMELPPVEVGIAGSLCADLVYEYCVETLDLAEFDMTALPFETMEAGVTHRTFSAPLQFTIHGIPTPTPSPEPTLLPYEPVATDVTPSIDPTPTPVLDENGLEVIPAPEG